MTKLTLSGDTNDIIRIAALWTLLTDEEEIVDALSPAVDAMLNLACTIANVFEDRKTGDVSFAVYGLSTRQQEIVRLIRAFADAGVDDEGPVVRCG